MNSIINFPYQKSENNLTLLPDDVMQLTLSCLQIIDFKNFIKINKKTCSLIKKPQFKAILIEEEVFTFVNKNRNEKRNHTLFNEKIFSNVKKTGLHLKKLKLLANHPNTSEIERIDIKTKELSQFCPNIQTLRVGATDHSHPLSDLFFLVHFTSLKSISISHSLTEYTCSQVLNISNLIKLELLDCDDFREQNFKEIGKLNRLRFLHLNRCDKNFKLIDLGSLKELQFLKIEGHQLKLSESDDLIPIFGKLQGFDLFSQKTNSRSILAFLKKHLNLHHLFINSARLSDDEIISVVELETSLRSLSLKNTSTIQKFTIIDGVWESFARMLHLKSLIVDIAITERQLELLSSSTSLKLLDVSNYEVAKPYKFAIRTLTNGNRLLSPNFENIFNASFG